MSAFDELDATELNEKSAGQQQVRSAGYAAVRQNPDQLAEAKRLGNGLGIPTPVAARNLDDVRQRASMAELDATAQASPKLGTHLQNPEFATLSRDDLATLSGVETLFNTRPSDTGIVQGYVDKAGPLQSPLNYSSGKIGGPSFRRQNDFVRATRGPDADLGSVTSGILQAMPQGGEAARQGMRLQFADAFGLEGMADDALAKGRDNQSAIRLSTPAFDSSTAEGLYGGGVSLLRQVPGLAASIATRSTVPSLAAAGLQTEAESYSKYRDRGGKPGESFVGAAGEGAVEVATEMLPMGFLVSKFGKAGAGQFLTGLLGREVPGEQVATLVQDAIDTAVANPNKTWGDYLKERPDAAYQTLLSTVVQAGAMGAGHTAVERLYGPALRAEAAAKDQEALTQLSEYAKASKLRERDPQSFQDFVNTAAADGPVQDIYVNAKELAASYEQAGVPIDQIPSPAVQEQIQEALTAGGDLRIPVGDYATNIAPTDINTALMPHLRTSAEGMSQTEAKEFMQSANDQFKVEAEKILAERQEDTAFQQSAAAVEAKVLGELQGANRFTDDVNTAYAKLLSSFYTVQAQRIGITPEEMFDRYQVKVRAEGVNGERVMNQPAYHGTPHNIGPEGFSTDKIGTGEGAQAYGHGLYFAESEGVAKDYQRRLTEDRFVKPDGEVFDPRSLDDVNIRVAFRKANGDIEAALKYAEEKLARTKPEESVRVWIENDIKKLKQLREQGGVSKTAGNLYQVDIPDEVVARMLLWDKPLGEQPESVQDALETLSSQMADEGEESRFYFQAQEGETGEQIYSNLIAAIREPNVDEETGEVYREGVSQANAAKEASSYLAHYGIPGIKYLDGISRNKEGEGNHNLVVFDAKDVNVTHKDGSPVTAKERKEYFQSDVANASNQEYDQDHGQKPTRTAGPTGDDLHRTIAGEDAAKGWISATSIRGADGNPKTLHRGARSTLQAGDFNEGALGAASGNPSAGLGVWFTIDPREATNYGTPQSFYLDVRNPLIVKVEDLPGFDSVEDAHNWREEQRAAGYDGVIVTAKHLGGRVHVVAFEPKQVIYPQEGVRGRISMNDDITTGPSVISLLKNADLSTFLHEMGHFQLEVLTSLALQPTTPPAIRDDMQAVLNWFSPGMQVEDWITLTDAEKTPYHEQFARGFEAYLFEGKSPNPELDGVFARLRAWLINVYKSIRSLHVDINDDIRGVFDRLIASEEAITAAQNQRNYAPLFKSIEDAGMTPDEWESYQALGKEATEEAVAMLETRSLRDMQWLTNARGRLLKKLQKEAETKRKAVEAEVTEEVKQQPAYAVQDFLKGDYHLDTELTLQEFPELKGVLNNTIPGMTGPEGLAPGLVAEQFGFSSASEMIDTIINAEPEASVIEGMTDQRMLERYGDLTSERAINRAVDEALHNDARAKFIAAELKALDRAVGNKTVLTKAAKQFAEQTIAKKRIRDVKPSQYIAAASRAAKAAERAKEVAEKAAQKRNQLINHYAARAAQEAVAGVEKGVAYLKKFDTEATRKSVDPEYIDQIDAMLERFDLRTGQSLKAIDKRKALVEWIKSQEDQGYEPTISDELRNEAFRKSFKDLTVEEFRGVVDAVKNIEHLGRLKKKLLTAADDREFAEVVGELTASIEDNAKQTIAERRASDRGFLVDAGKMFRNFFADHRKFASLAREMDGWKEAGPMWEYLVRSMNRSGDSEAVQREQATIKLSALMAPILKEGGLGKKQYFPSSGKSFTREERLGIALNMGNEINQERVISGEGLTPAALQDVLDTLTEQDWKFVQGVWDYLESFRPQIAAKERRLTGMEPDWVEGSPVETKFGTFKGGYYPIKYDPERSTKAEADTASDVQRQMERGLYTRAQTRRGHLKARIESTGRPLRYDLSVIVQHIDQVVHDLAWHEYLIDANRILRANSIDSSIRAHYGPEKLRTLRETLTSIAVGDLAAQTSSERVLNHIRQGATIAGLGWRVTTSLLQPLGLTQSMSRIGSKWVMKGTMHWAGDAVSMESSISKINEKSDFMRLRAKTMQREISEIRNKVKGEDSRLEASYFYLIQKMQLVADVPTWWGAYEKAYSEPDMSEDKAVALADQAVRDAQGAGQIGDLAAVQRGSAAWKLFTNFYSFFSTTYNLTAEAVGRTDFKKPGDVSLLAADLALLYTIPAMLSTLLKAALAGDWDDEEKLTRRMIADQLNYMLGTVVILREAGSAVQSALGLQGDYGGPASVRLFGELAKLGKQAQQGEADEAFWKALNSTAGILFHYPAGQINATASGVNGLATDRTDNPGALLVGAKK